MRHSGDDPFDDDNADREDWGEDLERYREALLEPIDRAVETHEIPQELVPLLLAEIAVTLRSSVYAAAARRPSASGLKLDLDRFQREFGDILRGMKRNADEFIQRAKEVMEAVPDDDEAEDEEELEDPN